MDRNEVLRRMRNAFRETVSRCHNPKHRQYRVYGGRGITVCDEWRYNFDQLVSDMGLRPDGMTLDRIDNDKGYSRDNCRWATRADQSKNSRAPKLVTWRGVTRCVAEWERELGFREGTLKARLGQLGYSVDEAFTKEVKCGGKLQTRAYTPRRKPDMSGVPRGFMSPNTRLSETQRALCEARWRAGESFSALGREFGVTVTTMSNACQGLKAYANRSQPC